MPDRPPRHDMLAALSKRLQRYGEAYGNNPVPTDSNSINHYLQVKARVTALLQRCLQALRKSHPPEESEHGKQAGT